MSPLALARRVYETEPCARSFDDDLQLHLRHGIVLSTPTCFAMIRPVWSRWSHEILQSPWWADPDGDCWMMWLAAGDITPVWDLGPSKSLVAWEQRNVLRIMPYDRFRRLYRSRPLAQA